MAFLLPPLSSLNGSQLRVNRLHHRKASNSRIAHPYRHHINHQRTARGKLQPPRAALADERRPPTPLEQPLEGNTNVNPATSETTVQTSTYDWLNNWYPVAWTVDIPTTKPHAFSLFGQTYVLYKSISDATVTIIGDKCPHRSAPLSEGRLFERDNPCTNARETILECPYHGWRFNVAGKCVDIPQLPMHGPIPRRAHLPRVYATAEVVGLLFFWPGSDDARQQTPQPPLPDQLSSLDDSELTRLVAYRRELPLNFVTVLENLVDPSHAYWAHHNVLRNRDSAPRNAQVRMMSRTDDERLQASVFCANEEDARSHFCFEGPVHFFNIGKGIPLPSCNMYLLAWVLPTGLDACTLFTVNVIPRAGWLLRSFVSLLPQWIECQMGHAVTDGDTPILRRQMENLLARSRDGVGSAWREDYGLACANWDALVIAMRYWFDAREDVLPVDWRAEGRLRNLSRRELNDRFEQHTVGCSACRRAFRVLNVVKWLALGAGVLAVVALVSAGACLISVGGFGIGASGVRQRRFLALCVFLALLAVVAVLMTVSISENMTYSERSYELSHMA